MGDRLRPIRAGRRMRFPAAWRGGRPDGGGPLLTLLIRLAAVGFVGLVAVAAAVSIVVLMRPPALPMLTPGQAAPAQASVGANS